MKFLKSKVLRFASLAVVWETGRPDLEREENNYGAVAWILLTLHLNKVDVIRWREVDGFLRYFR